MGTDGAARESRQLCAAAAFLDETAFSDEAAFSNEAS
jgi:hypothetical protein